MLNVNETRAKFEDLQKEIGRIIQYVHALETRNPDIPRLTPDEIAERLQKCRGMLYHLLRSYDHMVEIAMGLQDMPKSGLSKLKK